MSQIYDEQNEPVRKVAPFGTWLHEQRNGLAAVEWAEALHELIEAVTEQGKAGTVTFTIKVDPKGRTLMVTDDVKVKKPLPEREASLFFADRDSNLSRRDPDQAELPLQEVPRPAAKDLKEAGK